MAELQDLQNAVTALSQAVSDTATELNNVAQALIAAKSQPAIDPAAVEAAAQSVSTLAANLESAVAGTKQSTGV